MAAEIGRDGKNVTACLHRWRKLAWLREFVRRIDTAAVITAAIVEPSSRRPQAGIVKQKAVARAAPFSLVSLGIRFRQVVKIGHAGLSLPRQQSDHFMCQDPLGYRRVSRTIRAFSAVIL
jgi:hypothetical protein